MDESSSLVLRQERWQRSLAIGFLLFGVLFVCIGFSALGQPGGGPSALVTCAIFGLLIDFGAVNALSCYVHADANGIETRYVFNVRQYPWGDIEAVKVMRPRAMFKANTFVALVLSNRPRPVLLRCLWNGSTPKGYATLLRHAEELRALRPDSPAQVEQTGQ